MPGIIDKDARRLVKSLERQGCTIRRTGTGHLRITHHGAYVATLAGTTGDRRSLHNVRAAIRRAGLMAA